METFLKILEIIKWPLVAVIGIIFFYRPISGLINRVKGVKGGGYGFDTESASSQQTADKLLKEDKSKLGNIEKALNLFSDDTRKLFQDSILLETGIEKVTNDKDKVETLKNYSEALYILLHFERIYNGIFGSQIGLLNHLNSSFNETVDSAKFFYNNAVKVNPDLAKYPYDNYIEFLEIKNLVEIKDNKAIQITWLGRDFLKFIVQMGLSDLKPN
jgi:hypothetical protein